MRISCKIIHILIAVLKIAVLSSCNNNEELIKSDNQNVLHFDISDWEKVKTIPKDVIKKVNLIPLETADSCLLGDISKITSVEDKFYIIDRGINKKVFIFNNEGKFLGSIGKFGRGPGEFVSITDIAINEEKNQLFVLDAQIGKVSTFDLQNGKFLSSFKIDFVSTDFEIIDENALAFYVSYANEKNKNNHLVSIMNINDKSTKSFIEKDEFDTRVGNQYKIFKSTNTYLTSYFKEIVYIITPNEVAPFLTFDFGENKMQKKEIENANNDALKIRHLIESKAELTYGIENILENDSFLTFDIRIKKSATMVIYCKSTTSICYGNRYDSGLGAFRFIRNIEVSGNDFIGVIDSYYFMKSKQLVAKQADNDFIEEYYRALSSMSDNSNPVIITIEFNNF